MAPVVIVTGAGSGIGAATSRRLATEGWTVAAAGRRRDRIERIAAEISGLAVPTDMARPGDIEHLVEAVVSECGRLDALVLNAGVIEAGRVLDISIESWHRTMAINLHGPFMLVRCALPHLLRARGTIVAVGSVGAKRTGTGSAAYGSSKAALTRLIQSVAIDYGPQGIRANCVYPGWIRSEMADAEMDELGRVMSIGRDEAYGLVTGNVPSRRPGTADEAAAAIAWLLSGDASYVNAAIINVDGGTSPVSVGTLAFGGSAEALPESPRLDEG